ncbi:hypothetical protein [Nocardioides panacihumi]|uniref:hypothetical protein n=1 Tax=Nocardioides panacihumi TaxID=400774 RepID=UPI0031D7D4BA
MSPAIPTRVRRIARADLVLAVLLLAQLVLRVLLYPRVQDVHYIGDEKAYVDAARALSNLVRDVVGPTPVDLGEVRRNVVASGWFMPGMSVLLTPLLLVEPHASIPLVRGYLDVATGVLFLLAVLDVRRVLGPWYAVVLAVFGLVPMWLLFAATAYGDLTAGLVLVLLMTRLVAALRRVRLGTLAPLNGVGLGLLAIAVLYLRPSAMPLAIGLLLLLLLCAVWLSRGRARLRSVAAALIAVAVFGAVLLPWSVLASQTLGGRVLTTTSVPLGLGATFGDRDKRCFGPCDPDASLWYGPVRYGREVARATGRSEVTVQQQAARYAMQDVTTGSYARDVLADFDRYLHEPAHYSVAYHPPGKSDDSVQRAVVTWTERMFRLLMLGGAAVLLLVRRRDFTDQALSVVAKVALAGLLFQPFVHVSGARYWPTAAPVAALGLAMLGSALLALRPGAAAPARVGDAAPVRLFTVLQACCAVTVVAVWVALHVLAG